MAENENVIQTEIEPETQPEKKKKKSNGGFKEWWRKFLVNLKRKPQNIPLVIFAIGCAVYLCSLTVFSKCLYLNWNTIQRWSAIGVFICTLFSMLVIVSAMRIYPKHKKPSIAMMVVTYLFVALMIFMDIVYIVEIRSNMAEMSAYELSQLLAPETNSSSIAICIVHIVIEAIAAILYATLPLWRKLLMKINTRKEVESASSNMEAIDVQD